MTLVATFFLTGCFTGIETTGKINLSKKDLETVKPTEEDNLLSDITYESIKDWTAGKLFLVTDDKFSILVHGSGNNKLGKGDTIIFKRADSAISAGGGETTEILFDTKYGEVVFPIERDFLTAANNFTSSDLALTVDLDIVEQVGKKLKGRTVWTRSALWYDDSLSYKRGKKFFKVSIKDIRPGNSFFPLLVSFQGEDGEKGQFLMNLGYSGNESRNFSKLFSLSDPKDNYRNISKEHWTAIQNEQLRIGMTKEECKLSIGNPSDVDAGHNYSNTVEIWQYPDGSMLQFVDGLLINYK